MGLRRAVGIATVLTVLLGASLVAVLAVLRLSEGKVAVPVGRIAVLEEDGNIVTMAPDGADLRRVTEDASTEHQYRYPTWSPDGQTLAYVEVDTRGDEESSALHIHAPVGASAARIETPFPPFYLYWSPDSSKLAFLSGWETGTLALRLLDVGAGDEEPTTIGQGEPLFFSWEPTSDGLVAHIGGDELSLVDLEGERAPLEVSPGLFQAPAWSPSGQWVAFASRVAPGVSRLDVAPRDGHASVEIAEKPGLITFGWSPSGSRLAYSHTERAIGLPAFGPLWVRDLESGHAWELSREPVIAFFWSPDGEKLAFLRPEPTRREPRAPAAAPLAQRQKLWLRWHVWNGERTYPLARFSPSDPFLLDYLRYFDQYAQSIALWSPDSRSLLYTGEGEDGEEGVWTVGVDEGSEPTRIARGVLAAWSPR